MKAHEFNGTFLDSSCPVRVALKFKWLSLEERQVILLISYDLKGHERPSAYERVREMIEEKSLASKRILYSQWIVETEATVGDWHESLKLAADSTDNWFILEVTRPYKGWLPRSVWDWLNERL